MPFSSPILRVVGLAFFALLLSACSPGSSPTAPATDGAAQASATVTMTVDAKGYIPFDTAAGIPWKTGMTVGDAVRATREIQFGIKEYPDLGRLINAVNGLENNTHDGHYWQFCVDGVFSEIGMDEKPLAAGQAVSWYYRAYGEGPCKKIGE
jgi:Domain of unknown function (DUF4430)